MPPALRFRYAALLALGAQSAACVVVFDSDLPRTDRDDVLDADGGGDLQNDAGGDAGDPDATVDADTNDLSDVDPDTDAAVDSADADVGELADTCDDPNDCGGCSELDGQPGDPCGPCGLDELACSSDAALECNGATPCDGLPPLPPASLTASDGTFDSRVRLTWPPAAGAIAYRVYRTGTFVIETTATSLDDEDAPDAPAPDAPIATASRNRTDGILLSWDPPATRAATPVLYAVTSVGEHGESADSASDTGFRGPRTISGYEMAVSDGEWDPVTVSEAELGQVLISDPDRAPRGVVVAGTASASTEGATVELVASGFSVNPAAPVTLQVRAVAGEVAGAASDPVEGNRSVGSLSYRWERADAASGPWTSLSAAGSGASATDTTAPSDGSTVWYRAVGTAAGALEAASPAVPGSVGTVPDAPTSVTASTNRPDRIGVSWVAPAGPVTGYDVQVDGGGWTDVGNVLAWDDTGASPGSHTGCSSVTATDGTRTDGVLVTCTGAGYVPGRGRTYRVRAYNELGDGEPSDAVVGNRGGSTLSYTFERSAGPSDTAYSTVSSGAAAQYLDAGVAAGVTRYWRVRVELNPPPPGPSTAIVSTADSGFRGTE